MKLENKLLVQDLSVKNKRVLLRVDYNVPLNKGGSIADNTRILASLPTIKYLLESGSSILIMSHLGKPKGKLESNLSLKVCAEELSKLLNKTVFFEKDYLGSKANTRLLSLNPGEILVLENLRFHPAEENPDLDTTFAYQLSTLGDCYINDAFGCAHRDHSSITRLARYFPSDAALGFLMQKEISALSQTFDHPRIPFFAVVGGAKVSSKLGVLFKLSSKAQAFFIGGGMCYTFLKALGKEIGDSLCEDKLISEAEKFINTCHIKNIDIFLPDDVLISPSDNINGSFKIIHTQSGIPKGWSGVDIGPATICSWSEKMLKAKTIFWNGPMGIFEIPEFALGTKEIASAIARNKNCVSIIGGGDSVAAINSMKMQASFSHISTGGGASLEFIEKGTLPGIEALTNKNK
ncbi:MAG: phosphoglycerate kinase [Chlamydiae bacterium]|nr:phosphoglycerate kinase [Chlamydiota bacterium]